MRHMGKKSRRQRTKKVLTDAPPPAIKPLDNLAPEKLRGLGNELLDSQKYGTHDDERGRACRLIDALQRRDAGPFSCRCALAGVRCDVDEPGHNSDGRVLAAQGSSRNASFDSRAIQAHQALAPHPKVLAAPPTPRLLGLRKAI